MPCLLLAPNQISKGRLRQFFTIILSYWKLFIFAFFIISFLVLFLILCYLSEHSHTDMLWSLSGSVNYSSSLIIHSRKFKNTNWSVLQAASVNQERLLVKLSILILYYYGQDSVKRTPHWLPKRSCYQLWYLFLSQGKRRVNVSMSS